MVRREYNGLNSAALLPWPVVLVLGIPATKRPAVGARGQVRTPRPAPTHEHFRTPAFRTPVTPESVTHGAYRDIPAGVAWIQARLTRVVAGSTLRSTMSPFAKLIAGLFLAAACSQALGQSASFRVSVVVLPERVTSMPLDLPAPPQAQVLPASSDAKRLLYRGNPGAAMRFYESTLPELGFHLSRQDASSATWERADVRVELRFYPVIGHDATGIHVTISPRLSAG
jgi:hypothetical protein